MYNDFLVVSRDNFPSFNLRINGTILLPFYQFQAQRLAFVSYYLASFFVADLCVNAMHQLIGCSNIGSCNLSMD